MRFPPRLAFAGTVTFLALAAGCRPKYPICDSDKDCHPKEFCVERRCQQCRDSADCPAGQACDKGSCQVIQGYCRDRSECPAGQECIANRCRPCASDGECPSGTICLKGACTQAKRCKTDNDCAQSEDCVDGVCVPGQKKPEAPPTECNLAPPYFAFNEATLTSEATAALAQDAACMKKTGRAVELVGRADPRGTQEYNLALSERRAESVKAYLRRLGVSVQMSILPRGSLDAQGTDEPGWARDRRVDLEWK